MKFNRAVIAAFSVAVLAAIAGCATTGTDGIVQIGPDLYSVSLEVTPIQVAR